MRGIYDYSMFSKMLNRQVVFDLELVPVAIAHNLFEGVFYSKSFLDTLFAKSFLRMYIAELPQRSCIIYSVRKIGRSDNI